MHLTQILTTARSAAFLLDDGGIYHTKEPYRLRLDGREAKITDTVATSLFGLEPQTTYFLRVERVDGSCLQELEFQTAEESLTLNVRELGAAGDGISDDTGFLQAAILACPENGRVLIPEGTYAVTSVFLKSGVSVEIAKGAVLKAQTDRNRYVKFPGKIDAADGTEYHLGTWEGEPLPMFAGILTGIGVTDVRIYGEGTLDGCASYENWWYNEKVMVGAYRPRMLFLNHCKRVTVHGLHFCNSPAWVIHPFFSEDCLFCSTFIENPQVSPNTDGIDPESCRRVRIVGVHFSLGDDCIAVKSGKIYMGQKYKTPSEDIHVTQCLMENGHGAVTVGSEIGAGVRDMLVEKCKFSHTDRGLRIKTRRGRGKDSILDGITFRDIEMDNVMTPFTANAFYFCDPDGMSEYVQSRETYPVDARTPEMRRFLFENIHAENCHVAAAYFVGLPEKKIGELHMKNCTISFAQDAKSDVPIMTLGVDACSKKGIHAENVERLILENVTVTGQEGEAVELVNVTEVSTAAASMDARIITEKE